MSLNSSGKPRFTTETILYAIIILIGVGLRFALLGDQPLDDAEASLALQAMASSRGETIALAGEPGYLSLTTVLFFIFGPSDFWARFWPAILGAGTILLPLLYRARFGKNVSLLLAGFIALDPVLIGVSRTVDGSFLALVGLLAGIGLLLMRKLIPAGICLGLAFAGGQWIWSGLLLLLGVMGFNRIFPGTRSEDDPLVALNRKDAAIVAAIAMLTLVLTSMLFLMTPGGMSAIGSSLAEFFTSLKGISGGEFLAWLIMEFPFIILALWGMVDGLLRKDATVRLLASWWGLGMVMSIITTGDGVNRFFWVSIPVLTLAAIKTAELISERSIQSKPVFFAESLLVIALFVFSFLNLLALINNVSLGTEETRNRIIGALLPIILLVILTVLLTWGWSATSTRKGFIAGVLVLLSLALISNTWKAASLGSAPEQELANGWSYPIGRENLIKTISDLSRWNTGYDDRIDVLLIGSDQPSLLWALRDFEDLRMETGYNPSQLASLVITGVDQSIESSSSYRGQKILWSVEPDTQAMSLKDWMKWVFFRQAPVEKSELVLWARNDLFAGTSSP